MDSRVYVWVCRYVRVHVCARVYVYYSSHIINDYSRTFATSAIYATLVLSTSGSFACHVLWYTRVVYAQRTGTVAGSTTSQKTPWGSFNPPSSYMTLSPPRTWACTLPGYHILHTAEAFR